MWTVPRARAKRMHQESCQGLSEFRCLCCRTDVCTATVTAVITARAVWTRLYTCFHISQISSECYCLWFANYHCWSKFANSNCICVQFSLINCYSKAGNSKIFILSMNRILSMFGISSFCDHQFQFYSFEISWLVPTNRYEATWLVLRLPPVSCRCANHSQFSLAVSIIKSLSLLFSYGKSEETPNVWRSLYFLTLLLFI